MTAALASLLILGLFVDGWNHINLQDGKLGGFFTPWHGLLYTGFSATAIWVISRNMHVFGREAASSERARPLAGVLLRYPLAVAGIAVATVGLFGDLAWHELFGEEEGVARVIGPFHLLLFTGAGLLITGSFRSAWHSASDYPVAPSIRTMLPPLLSLTLITAMGAFLFQWLSAFMEWEPAFGVDRVPGGLGKSAGVEETVEISGVARVVVTNLVLMAPLLLALLRWRPPVGSFTFMFTSVAALMSALTEFRLGGTIAAAVAGGFAADVLVRRLRTSPKRPGAYRWVAGVVPIVLWSVYFVVLGLIHDIHWPLDLAIGTVGLASVTGLLLSVLVAPPAVPDSAWRSTAQER
ncbi:MAG: hypothetical protein LC790_16135 [Actinobacteria bacterium]|nr:hypothetical protein [Actinomycetota bacterium]